jgi:hypothetical protein
MIPKRYSLSNLKKAVYNPSLLSEEVGRITGSVRPKNINKKLNKFLYKDAFTNQTDVMSEDWDNLIILDGFRYDFFESNNNIDGELSSIISQGSHSTEFLEKTFVGKKFHDTVYITSNPHAPRYINEDVFYFMKSVYSPDRVSKPREHYPEKVIDMALPIIDEHPNKKHIIHLMQPNVPFLGPTAEKLRERLFEQENITFVGMEPSELPDSYSPRMVLGELKEAAEKGYISDEELKKAYEENTTIALRHAQQLLEEIEGKTGITADHGEMLGEPLPPMNFKQYSHKRHLYVDELRKVPWLVIDSENRREIYSEDPITDEMAGEDVIKDRLKQLGYLDYV